MKSNIEIKKTGITNIKVDAIVNAANQELQEVVSMWCNFL